MNGASTALLLRDRSHQPILASFAKYILQRKYLISPNDARGFFSRKSYRSWHVGLGWCWSQTAIRLWYDLGCDDSNVRLLCQKVGERLLESHVERFSNFVTASALRWLRWWLVFRGKISKILDRQVCLPLLEKSGFFERTTMRKVLQC